MKYYTLVLIIITSVMSVVIETKSAMVIILLYRMILM